MTVSCLPGDFRTKELSTTELEQKKSNETDLWSRFIIQDSYPPAHAQRTQRTSTC